MTLPSEAEREKAERGPMDAHPWGNVLDRNRGNDGGHRDGENKRSGEAFDGAVSAPTVQKN